MALGLKMSMKLSQQLKMTPRLQQAIKLLQLSRMELDTAIRKELDENPVLEEVHDFSEDSAEKETEIKSSDEVEPNKKEEFELENYLDNPYKSSQGSSLSDEVLNYENIISTTTSLHEHLTWQAGMAGFNDEELNIVLLLINYINDNGYLKIPLAEIAKIEVNLSEESLEEMLPFVQELDPPGVGARDLKECLLLQAKHLQEDTKDLVHIIENHLKDLEKKNFPRISKAMNVDTEYVVDLCQIIFDMDPKPGRMFVTQDTHFIVPDVYIHKVSDEYVVSLNDEGLPRLKISNLYKNLMKSTKGDNKQTKEYIRNKLNSAVWLIKSIHQRQRTIYKVTESIVKHQLDFFEQGPGFLKPMVLRDVANDIEMHESTVSRVTTNKYAHTSRGIFELKYFFNSGIKTQGVTVATESIKLKVKKMIQEEDPYSPLSDQKIVDILKKDGISLARRTIAKYRETLNILPSSKRKRYY